jgi:hypothetical protein
LIQIGSKKLAWSGQYMSPSESKKLFQLVTATTSITPRSNTNKSTTTAAVTTAVDLISELIQELPNQFVVTSLVVPPS